MCDKFQPTVLNGQLCYSLDIAKLTENETKSGKTHGLFLLLDPNPYQLDYSNEDGNTEINKQQSFNLFIHTLAQFTAFQPGSFAMSSLKRMTATTSFNRLPDNQKKCTVHNREECQTKKFLNQVENKCGCLPWALVRDNRKAQVRNKSQIKQFHFAGAPLLWPTGIGLCCKPNSERQKLLDCLHWSLC